MESFLRDASFNPMQNGQYGSFLDDATHALNSIFYLKISIYSDGSGNNFALDSSGDIIQNRLITNISYSYPYTDSDTQLYIPGIIKMYFEDGNFFTNDDQHEESFWYSLEGMPQYGIKQFT